MRDLIDYIVVLDTETTGFDERLGCLLEIGWILCDLELREIARDSMLLRPTAKGMHHMDPTAEKMHETSGLMKQCRTRAMWGTLEAEEDVLAQLVEKGCQPKRTMMAGNSVHFDWRWLREHMPRLCDFFHHRLLDVSVLHAVAGFWGEAALKPVAKHRALDDCVDSLEAIRWYKDRLFRTLPVANTKDALEALRAKHGDGVIYTITRAEPAPIVLPWTGEEPGVRPLIVLGEDGMGRNAGGEGGHK